MKTTAILRILLSAGVCFSAQGLLIACTTSVGGTAIAEPPKEGRPVDSFAQIVEPKARISRETLLRLNHVAIGNSDRAMRDLVGTYPYAFTGNTEWYPIKNDPATWIGLEFDENGSYQGFKFSFNNNLTE